MFHFKLLLDFSLSPRDIARTARIKSACHAFALRLSPNCAILSVDAHRSAFAFADAAPVAALRAYFDVLGKASQ